MRYFAMPRQEGWEAEHLAASFGKTYAPAGRVTLSPSSVIDRFGTDIIEVRGEPLGIHPDAGGWAFLTAREADVLSRLRQVNFGSLSGDWQDHHMENFVARLYRRGLVSIDGTRAVDAAMFDDSPNYVEGHLVEMLLTEKCNLACGYCLAGANPKMPTMTPELARRTVDLAFAMHEAPVLGFEFSGGEPFLKFDLMRTVVEYITAHPGAAGRRVYLSVQTNGTLLNAERVEWLRTNNVSIGVSLDGHPWSQNRSRPMLNGGESFRRLIAGIDLLQRGGVRFGALVVLNRSNVGSVEDLVDFLLDNDIRSFKLNPVSFLGTARSNWDDVGLTSEEVLRYFVELIDILTRRRHPLLEANLHTMVQFLTSKRRTTRCMRGHCGAGDTFQAVSASGDIYPCGRATQTTALKLGNVSDIQLVSLSEPGRRSEQIAAIRSRRPSTLEGCATCYYRQFCQAGCSAQAFERYGTVRHRTPECDFYKTLYPYLMHELSFSRAAFEAFRGAGYFGQDGVLIDDEFGVPADAAAPA